MKERLNGVHDSATNTTKEDFGRDKIHNGAFLTTPLFEQSPGLVWTVGTPLSSHSPVPRHRVSLGNRREVHPKRLPSSLTVTKLSVTLELERAGVVPVVGNPNRIGRWFLVN